MIDSPDATDWAKWTLTDEPETEATVPRNVGSLLSIGDPRDYWLISGRMSVILGTFVT